MHHRNAPRMQMGEYFSRSLGHAMPNDDIIVTSQQRFVSGVVVCQLVCRLAVDILNIFLVTHCPYADLLTNFTLKCAN